MRYVTETQEWIELQGDEGTFGLTKAAQLELGEIVYVGTVPVGDQLQAGQEMVVLESLKAAVDLLAPAACVVLEVNPQVMASPTLLQQDPEGSAWLLKVRFKEPVPLSSWQSLALSS